jgi:S-DNA-T family DNA segregation ATPase FtsK/SpoIIIE
MTAKKSTRSYKIKGQKTKKRSRADKMHTILAFLILFIASALFFSGGTFGGFLKVFLSEIVIIGIIVFAALKSRTKPRNGIKSYPDKKRDNSFVKRNSTTQRTSTVRRGKRNYNWVVEPRKKTNTKADIATQETKAAQNSNSGENAGAGSVQNEEKKFVPYRSPFDPIIIPRKEEEQLQGDDAEYSDREEADEDIAEGNEVETPDNEDIESASPEPDVAVASEQTIMELPFNSAPCIMMEMPEDREIYDRSGHQDDNQDDETAENREVEDDRESLEIGVDAMEEFHMAKRVQEYSLPPIELLNGTDGRNLDDVSSPDMEDSAKKLVETLASFGVGVKVMDISKGPSVTRYELQPDIGVKVSKIVGLTDDIALNLAAAGVRIEAPIPGKAAVGIEVPNKEVEPVYLKEVLESPEFANRKSRIAFALGKDVAGKTVVADIAKMPHLLIAGATGSGKSVCINTLIISILYKYLPSDVKLIMVDPKVVELSVYNGIPHLLIPVVTDPKKAAGALNWAVQEMNNRYKLFADNNVRDIRGYNSLLKEKGQDETLPQVVIIIDELADLMMAAPGEVEDSICRLAQMARAAGMHLVIATQRPSVDVITGLIKANIPSRIAFAVSSQVDSRTILDMAGAEKLLGKGDMLFSPVGGQKPLRIQGAFISDREVEAVVSHVKAGTEAEYDEEVLNKIDNHSVSAQVDQSDEDELLPQAIDMVMEIGQASTSMIQRKLRVGYTRAARMLDQMEERGIVGPPEGSKPRKVLISKQ